MRPTDRRSRGGDFVSAQGLTVRFGGSGALGRALTNHRLALDQGRRKAPAQGCVATVGGPILGHRKRPIQRPNVMAVDACNDVPTVGLEALDGIVAPPILDLAIDRNAVVIPQRDQFAELPNSGERTSFVRNAFHQATVAHKNIGIVVNHRKTRTVVLERQPGFGQGHANRVRQTLSERTSRGLNARRNAKLRMARSFRMHLAKLAQFADWQVIARQMQQRVQQHRAVAIGQHEPVAIGPMRITGVVL